MAYLHLSLRRSCPVGGLVIAEDQDRLLRAVCVRLFNIEPKLTEMDTICGDGGMYVWAHTSITKY